MGRAGKKRRAEAGVVLLIAIFVLMLVSVVAIALIVSSGTETALASNYRSSAAVYYASMAGLEEARQRLQSKSPDYFNQPPTPNFMPLTGTALPLTSVRYIINPSGGEIVAPWDSTNAYYDREYGNEFPTDITGVPDVQPIPSVSGTNAAGLPGPVFKWVRINAVTEAALHIDVNRSGGALDPATLVYYDPKHTDGFGTVRPSLIKTGSLPASAVQALEITSLAVLPDGSQKLLQYVVAPGGLDVPHPAALTIAGTGVQYAASNVDHFLVKGDDGYPTGTCTASPLSSVGGLGYSSGDYDAVLAAVNAGTHPDKYTGYPGGTPNLLQVGNYPVADLDVLMQNVRNAADLTSLPSTMSSSSPKVIFIDGDLTLNPTTLTTTGYGLLAVTGKLTYDGRVSWNGVILVIGEGIWQGNGTSGSGEIHGSVFVARTHSPNPGQSQVDFYLSHTDSNGFLYSHCWIDAVVPPSGYKVLSFREVPQ